jgi:hypothetical protein
MAAGVEIKHGSLTYGGSLLEFWHDDESDTYRLQLNPRILVLYKDGWTAIDWETRRQLRGKPLALWLDGWLCSNAENYPVKVETIHHLSGSRNTQKAGFKRHLVKAIADLKAVGRITCGKVEGDLMTIDRTPSPSQIRHITKKARKSRNSRKP